VITNKKKSLLPDRTVTSFCMGSQNLYDFVDNNPAFYFRSSDFVNDPLVIARNDNLITISSHWSRPHGQVCSDSLETGSTAASATRWTFCGQLHVQRRFSIIALPLLPATARIAYRASLSEGAGVATTRAMSTS